MQYDDFSVIHKFSLELFKKYVTIKVIKKFL